MELTSTTIPAWLVAFFMIWAGLMWYVSRKRSIRMDSRIFAYTLFFEGIIYGIVFQFFNVDLEVRGFYGRFMLILLCFSQAFPLTISYFRSINRDNK